MLTLTIHRPPRLSRLLFVIIIVVDIIIIPTTPDERRRWLATAGDHHSYHDPNIQVRKILTNIPIGIQERHLAPQ